MRVELLSNTDGRVFSISSQNLKIIGDWFADLAPCLMTNNATLWIRMQIWPDTHAEAELIGTEGWDRKLTQDELLALSERILEVSQLLADREEKLRRTA